jgi:hypothetical protein
VLDEGKSLGRVARELDLTHTALRELMLTARDHFLAHELREALDCPREALAIAAYG